MSPGLPRLHFNAPEPVDVPVSATEAPLRMSLQEVMALYKVPGLSMAIVDGYRITQAKAYGVTDAASRTPVTSKTLFQAGSISKPVAAVLGGGAQLAGDGRAAGQGCPKRSEAHLHGLLVRVALRREPCRRMRPAGGLHRVHY